MRRRGPAKKVVFLIGVIGGLVLLALATKGVVAKPLRPSATGPSPGAAQIMQLQGVTLQVGRPSRAELVARCQQRPTCRAALDLAQKDRRLAPRSAVSVHLTPKDRTAYPPYSDLGLYGVTFRGPYEFEPTNTTDNSNSQNKPYVQVRFDTPADGWYVINVRASRATAKLRHGPGGDLIETWEHGSVPCTPTGSAGEEISDYVTTENWQKWWHAFIFYSPKHRYRFWSVSIESYP